jgi:hypothetical protein
MQWSFHEYCQQHGIQKRSRMIGYHDNRFAIRNIIFAGKNYAPEIKMHRGPHDHFGESV